VKILLIASEAVPFAKTGGLADVAGSLPIALSALGHDVRLVMPLYKSIDPAKFGLRPILAEIDTHFPGVTHRGYVQRATLPQSSIPVYFIQHDGFFGREQFYDKNGHDYPDNPMRFAFFCLASLWMLKGLDWQPDLIHCHDWQAALAPAYLRHHPEMSKDPFYARIKTLFTIHNMAFQCVVDSEWMTRLNLPWSLFTPEGVEYYGKLNIMKAGLLYSNYISTVSRQYAKEIRTPEFGCGLEGILEKRSSHLAGILNGIDTSVWNPKTDTLIPAQFSAGNLKGKTKCKEDLQKYFGFPPKPGTPIIGMISRLTEQKGFDLVAEAMDSLMEFDLRLVVLGLGDPKYHQMLESLARRYPQKIGVKLGFDDKLAHWIEAGSDMFLMPSRFEPCGLNQFYSLRYGTIPIVRKTGGLADSIINATPATIKSGAGTGFVFVEPNPKRMLDAARRAVSLYKGNPTQWSKLIQNAMNKDYSWEVSAKEYAKLYKKITG